MFQQRPARAWPERQTQGRYTFTYQGACLSPSGAADAGDAWSQPEAYTVHCR